MKDLFTIGIAGILLWWVAMWPIEELRADEIKEFFVKTPSGEVVLTREPCEYTKMGLKGYAYAAYVIKLGQANHEGCWTMDIIDRFKAVKVYFPQSKSTEFYNPALFEPRLPKSAEQPSKSPVRVEPNRIMIYKEFTF
jgi:hypothetical protein